MRCCAVSVYAQIQPRTHVLDHADYTAPTWQHGDTADHADHADRFYLG